MSFSDPDICKLCAEGKLDVDDYFPIRFLLRGVSRVEFSKHLTKLRKSHGIAVAKKSLDHAYKCGILP